MHVKLFIGALNFEISQNCTHTKWVGFKNMPMDIVMDTDHSPSYLIRLRKIQH